MAVYPWIFFVPHIAKTGCWRSQQPRNTNKYRSKNGLKKTPLSLVKETGKGEYSKAENFWKITALLQPKLTHTHTHSGPIPLCWDGITEWAGGIFTLTEQ